MTYALVRTGAYRAGQRDRTRLAWVTEVAVDGTFRARTASINSLPSPTWTKSIRSFRKNQLVALFGRHMPPTKTEVKAAQLSQTPRPTTAETMARYA